MFKNQNSQTGHTVLFTLESGSFISVAVDIDSESQRVRSHRTLSSSGPIIPPSQYSSATAPRFVPINRSTERSVHNTSFTHPNKQKSSSTPPQPKPKKMASGPMFLSYLPSPFASSVLLTLSTLLIVFYPICPSRTFQTRPLQITSFRSPQDLRLSVGTGSER
ncbi:hypothetical protein SISSUDRAFT_1054460 [Sistotremastrum suecicum HHB10207 ss-3]|uniref:Uncharacterized protein n=1 Tax=Sistotremastrum suecicum HHB10207 ss-3 TaxID=1314776 RepID=A0A165YHE8_9AGAM|nr:hypothetical protein SISSUDRAFT_1054460 [Sistotremastrum suecicum HHB10207 ss-3]